MSLACRSGRLRTDTERRLNETAQFLMDVSAPHALDPGGTGISRILHVRLMHAAVRWLIEHDPAVAHVVDQPPPDHAPTQFTWSTSWGLPGNQEDLVGTWLTFTVVVYDAFDASGVVYDERDVADHADRIPSLPRRRRGRHHRVGAGERTSWARVLSSADGMPMCASSGGTRRACSATESTWGSAAPSRRSTMCGSSALRMETPAVFDAHAPNVHQV